MSNDLLNAVDLPSDDGFRHTFDARRTAKGMIIRWSAEEKWVDREGVKPPSPLLVIAVNEVLQRWRNDRPETITEKPLPDVDALNASIPVSEWETGLDGNPRKPWAHTVVVYFIDPASGGFYTYMSATTGGHIAFNFLKEAVMSMRMLRGAKVMPLVTFGERPMKTKYGTKSRPHFEIVGWKSPEDAPALPEPPAPAAAPAIAAPAKGRRARPAANSGLVDVKPVTLQEAAGGDDVPW